MKEAASETAHIRYKSNVYSTNARAFVIRLVDDDTNVKRTGI